MTNPLKQEAVIIPPKCWYIFKNIYNTNYDKKKKRPGLSFDNLSLVTIFLSVESKQRPHFLFDFSSIKQSLYRLGHRGRNTVTIKGTVCYNTQE